MGKKYLIWRLFALAVLLCVFFSCGIRTAQVKTEAGNDAALSTGPNPNLTLPGIQPLFRNPQTLPEPVPRDGPHFALIPENPRPGEPVTIAYADNFFGSGSRELEAVLLDAKERRQARAVFFSFTRDERNREVKTAVLAVPSTANPEAMTIRIQTPGRIIMDLPLIVEKRDFDAERLHLDQRNTDIRTAPNPQREADAAQLWNILSRTGSEVYAEGLFHPPVSSTRRTSFFGSRRIYQYVNGSTDTSIHAGVDYGVPTGTKVLACARGKVVLAKFRIVTGYSVVLEHYPGVYSLYYHLDSINAEEGSVVETGTLLGLSGSTGLATGPHLHWEIRAAGENTDPDVFLERAVLDKNLILGKIDSNGNF
ncbi:MAG: M23 family metallopeptidase [Treponema sp.]|nr:M23 family metallopeptidase [Treponema sp.]